MTEIARKHTKAATDYTDHAKMRAQQCYLCEHWSEPNQCQVVEGKIARGGWCKLWRKR